MDSASRSGRPSFEGRALRSNPEDAGEDGLQSTQSGRNLLMRKFADAISRDSDAQDPRQGLGVPASGGLQLPPGSVKPAGLNGSGSAPNTGQSLGATAATGNNLIQLGSLFV